ncbi:alpha/beta hydrolase [Azospirillum canadense]|uniref:alpha/beta hydrolase n=1 Tax=Azospirillum canadense TaxID=403962 RepID=UPI002225CD6E|nr:alpha/beta hydrolase [Azospirillum canadense]
MPDIHSTTTGPGLSAAKSIVMVHGAFAGAWCFEVFRGVFRDLGWTVHDPDLKGHGVAVGTGQDLVGVGMADYRADLTAFLQGFPEPPVLLGHSMGGVLVQQLAADGLARALVLVDAAPRAGILPSTDSERTAAQGLMSLGPFWTTVVHPNFAVAAGDSLNGVPADERRAVFDRFGPESGRALFELFFWMLDRTKATAVDVGAVRCPVLCVSGREDRIVSPETARASVSAFRYGTYREAPGHGHMLLVEPGAADIARSIAEWLPV